MIIDRCDVVFENKEITQKVTLLCLDLIGTNQTCSQGNLVSGMCQFEICPDGFTDNNDNCKKEVLPITPPCFGFSCYTGRLNNNFPNTNPLTTFFSYIIFQGCTGDQVNINDIFSNMPYISNKIDNSEPITITINGIDYNEFISTAGPGLGGIIYLQNDPYKTTFPNSIFTAGQKLQGNTGGAVDGRTTVSKVVYKGVTYKPPVQNNTVTCTPGSTLIDGKCYETTAKIQSQEVPITNTTVTKQKALSQTVIVKKGETKSTVSERHVQQLAKDLLNQKISQLQPKCEPIPLFYNTLQTKTAKKNCTTGTPCDITITVNPRQFTSTESQEIADNLAKAEVERLFGLSVPCCIPDVIKEYLSEAKEYLYSKSCSTERLSVVSPRGGNVVFRGITIPSFTSNISQQDANQKRDNWFIANKTSFDALIICPEIPPVIVDEIVRRVVVSSNEGGTATPIGDRTVKDKSDFAYSATPSSGYEIWNIFVNGVSIQIPNRLSFSDSIVVNENKTIRVEFRQKPAGLAIFMDGGYFNYAVAWFDSNRENRTNVYSIGGSSPYLLSTRTLFIEITGVDSNTPTNKFFVLRKNGIFINKISTDSVFPKDITLSLLSVLATDLLTINVES